MSSLEKEELAEKQDPNISVRRLVKLSKTKLHGWEPFNLLVPDEQNSVESVVEILASVKGLASFWNPDRCLSEDKADKIFADIKEAFVEGPTYNNILGPLLIEIVEEVYNSEEERIRNLRRDSHRSLIDN